LPKDERAQSAAERYFVVRPDKSVSIISTLPCQAFSSFDNEWLLEAVETARTEFSG
jgi:hypothetical protein